MSLKKSLILGAVILSSLFIILVGWGRNRMNSITLSEFLERADSSGIRLIIYYSNPNSLVRLPVSVELLTENFHDIKIIIQDESRVFYTLENLADVNLIPVEDEIRINAWIHYVFETENGQRLFDVTFLRRDNHNIMIVNGVKVEANALFYEAIMPFLPAQAAQALEIHLRSGH